MPALRSALVFFLSIIAFEVQADEKGRQHGAEQQVPQQVERREGEKSSWNSSDYQSVHRMVSSHRKMRRYLPSASEAMRVLWAYRFAMESQCTEVAAEGAAAFKLFLDLSIDQLNQSLVTNGAGADPGEMLALIAHTEAYFSTIAHRFNKGRYYPADGALLSHLQRLRRDILSLPMKVQQTGLSKTDARYLAIEAAKAAVSDENKEDVIPCVVELKG